MPEQRTGRNERLYYPRGAITIFSRDAMVRQAVNTSTEGSYPLTHHHSSSFLLVSCLCTTGRSYTKKPDSSSSARTWPSLTSAQRSWCDESNLLLSAGSPSVRALQSVRGVGLV